MFRLTSIRIALAAVGVSIVWESFYSFAWAKDVILFSAPEVPVLNYYSIREAIQYGDTLIFSGHETYRVGKKLGCGNTTCVYELLDYPNQAIRIPRSRGVYYVNAFSHVHYSDFIMYFLNGKRFLNQYGVPSVKIYEGKNSEFIRVEKVQSVTDLKKFLLNPYLYSEEDRLNMKNELIRFARMTSELTRIGDFKEDQLHYVKDRGWILLDWTSSHRVLSAGFQKRQSANIFEQVFEGGGAVEKFLKRNITTKAHRRWLQDLKKELESNILEKRRSRTASSCLS